LIFSVVVTTRNRPLLLRRALASICSQTYRDFEVVVVNDGSSSAFTAEYAALADHISSIGKFYDFPPSDDGYGPSYARNYGVDRASGTYVAFLDDDDEWIDTEYLSSIVKILTNSIDSLDFHFANQVAVRSDGSTLNRIFWIEDLKDILPKTLRYQSNGFFLVSPSDLLQSRGFPHVNATIVRRRFFLDLKGFDVHLRYEEDRDFYLRGIDSASVILYSPRIVSRHYVPDPASRSTASTTLSADQRAFDQLRLLDKSIVLAQHREIRDYGKRHKAYTLKNIARRQVSDGDYERALFYGMEALCIGFNAKWLVFVGWIWLQRALVRLRVP